MTKNKDQGFTLIEILLVVGLIAILVAITIIAINPAKHFRDTRNTERGSEIKEILNAVTQYTSEEGHTVTDLGTISDCSSGSTAIGTAVGNIDLGSTLVDEYIGAIPTDPQGGDDADTGYTMCLTASGRVQIDAPNAEGKTVSVTR